MKKILFLLLAIPNLVTANGKESNQQIDQQTAPVVTPTPPHPSIKQRLSQKAATVAKLSKDLNDLQWKKLGLAPLQITVGFPYMMLLAYCLSYDNPYRKYTRKEEYTKLALLLTSPIVGAALGAITAVGATAVGAAKIGNSIIRKSLFGTKKAVDFVKEKLSSSSKKQ